MYVYMYGWMYVGVDRWMDGRMYVFIYVWMDGWMDVCPFSQPDKPNLHRCSPFL